MNSFCSYFNENVCRSCDLIHINYDEQIKFKENILKNSLKHILPELTLLPTQRSRQQGFRNKAKLVVTGSLENPILGLWGDEILDQGRELLSCPLHHIEINKCLPRIKEFITLCKLVPYNINSRQGELKGIILFYSESTHEMYLRLVLRSKESITRITKYQSFLFDHIDSIKVLSANIQPVPHAILEGEEEIFISTNTSIQQKFGLVTMSLGPRAFVQTNQELAEKLYGTAAHWVSELKTERFLELFCGQGAFSFLSAPFIQKGLGIEINTDAVIQANLTAQKFGFTHLTFKSADASSVEEEMAEFSPSLVLVNPPRRGLDKALDLLLKEAPESIIYSSCSYESLTTDLTRLSASYEVRRIQIFDLFPQTKHFETLVELRKKSISA